MHRRGDSPFSVRYAIPLAPAAAAAPRLDFGPPLADGAATPAAAPAVAPAAAAAAAAAAELGGVIGPVDWAYVADPAGCRLRVSAGPDGKGRPAAGFEIGRVPCLADARPAGGPPAGAALGL